MKMIEYLDRYNLSNLSAQEEIFSPEDINPILKLYFIPKEENIIDKISINSIVGIYDNVKSQSLSDLLMVYYQDGDPYDYFSRANGLLDYSPSELRKILDSGLQSGSINVRQMEKNKYFIYSNGIHRFLMLKLAYLHEQRKGNTNELLEKYKIPVTATKCDFIKSYCYFLLSRYSQVEIDRIKNPESGRVETSMGKVRNPSDKEVVDSVMNNVDLNNDDFIYLMKKVPSFNGFMQILNPKLKDRCDSLVISDDELNTRVDTILNPKKQEFDDSADSVKLPSYVDAFSFFGNPMKK